MNNDRIRILLVDDDEDDYFLTREVLSEIEDQRFDLEWMATYDAAREAILGNKHDVCLVDYHLGAHNGLELIREVLGNGCRTPLILLTGQGDREVDIEAMNLGAADYLVKGRIDVAVLERSIRYAIQRKRTEEAKADLEEQLLQSQKMESIGQLAGGVAHEFNNLLTPIIGYTELMRMKLSPEDGLYSGLVQIQEAAERAAKLTRQLLSFSRRQMIEPKVIDLNDIVVELFILLRHLIGEDIELVLLPAQEVKLVKADHSQIEQILINLAINARDAMPDGGKITIETTNIILNQDRAEQASQVPPGEYVMLAVRDSGTGMTDEVKAHIFEPFFTTKEVGKGTGLGLASSYGIIKQCGGHIEVHSELNQGTSFQIYLPTVDEAFSPPPERNVYDEVPGGTETILLAEDEPRVRAMTAILLRDQGYTVLEAANGDEALFVAEKHAREEIHLLLTDVIMPRMSGIELSHKFGSIRPKTRVLLMSGYMDEVIPKGEVLDNSITFLPKPFTPAALASKVREVLDDPIPRSLIEKP